MKSNRRQVIDVILSIFFSMIAAAHSLAHEEIGKVRIQKAVTAAFDRHEFDSKFRYYFYGLENSPVAMAGVRNDYIFNNIEWTEINPNSPKYKHILELIKRFSESRPVTGAYIETCRDEIIGTYYSGQGTGVIIERDGKRLILNVRLPGSDARP